MCVFVIVTAIGSTLIYFVSKGDPTGLQRSIFQKSSPYSSNLVIIAHNYPQALISQRFLTCFMYLCPVCWSQKIMENSILSDFWYPNMTVPLSIYPHLCSNFMLAKKMAGPTHIAILRPFPSQETPPTFSVLAI